MAKIAYIDGIRWHRALIAGANNVLSRQEYLNKINVFPVPDGDTGTNMAFTLTAIIESTMNKIHPNADQMLAYFADAALDGARGNSGVILAQFFQGLSDGSVGIEKMTPEKFAIALEYGSKYARQALATPQEGTILTIITDFSNHIIKLISTNDYDFETLLQLGIKEAEKSLKNTPNLLPILKKSGVVDAGAQGFVDLLNGILHYINNGNLKDFDNVAPNKKININHQNNNVEFAKSKFRFCTECLVKGNKIDHKKIREALQEYGDSLVIAGSRTKTKLHIHTNNTLAVFNICKKFGILSGEKADDMWKQQKTKKTNSTIAIVTDSGADIPDEIDLDIHIVPVRYNFGSNSYIDKISQSPKEFYHELETNSNHPQTSQPTPGDFRRQYQYLQSHYDSIISIHIPKNMSGTYQSALNASKYVNNATISIKDGFSASVGLGLIVMKSAKLVNDGKSFNEINDKFNDIVTSTSLYVVVNDLNYIVKGGRLPKWVKNIADFFHFRPIMTTKTDGKMGAAGIIKGKNNLTKKLGKFILNKLDNNKSYDISIGHCNVLNNGEKLKSIIQNSHKNINDLYLIDMGCALGVHAGPGSLAIAIQTKEL